MRRSGFTLIELLVVMSIVGLLASLVAPRYVGALDEARDRTLRHTLVTMRDAIDQFAADRGRYPEDLGELVSARYLRAVPEDPVTGRRDRWLSVAPAADGLLRGSLADVRSSAPGRARDGTAYADW